MNEQLRNSRIRERIESVPSIGSDEIVERGEQRRREHRRRLIAGAVGVAVLLAGAAAIALATSSDSGSRSESASENPPATVADSSTTVNNPTVPMGVARNEDLLAVLAGGFAGDAREADPVTSVEELAERSDTAICGAITSIERGRVFSSGGLDWYMATWTFEARAVPGVSDTPPAEVALRVSLPMPARTQAEADTVLAELQASVPAGATCAFLHDITAEVPEESRDGSLYAFTTLQGLLILADDLWTTPLDPGGIVERQLQEDPGALAPAVSSAE